MHVLIKVGMLFMCVFSSGVGLLYNPTRLLVQQDLLSVSERSRSRCGVALQ